MPKDLEKRGKTWGPSCDKFEVFFNHMAQVQTCDCIVGRRNRFEEGCCLIYACTQFSSNFPELKYCNDYLIWLDHELQNLAFKHP